MRFIFLPLMVSLCFLSLSSAQTSHYKKPAITFSQLLERLSPIAAKKIPLSLRETKLQHTYVGQKKISFYFDDFYYGFEWVDQGQVLMRFNGRAFYRRDFRTYKTLKKAFINRFGLYDHQANLEWLNRRKGRSSANLQEVTSLEDLGDDDFGDGRVNDDKPRRSVNFEGVETEEFYFGKVDKAPDISATALGQTTAAIMSAFPAVLDNGMSNGAQIATLMLAGIAAYGAQIENSPGFVDSFGAGTGVNGKGVESIRLPHHKK